MFSFIYTKICTNENLPLYGTSCKVTDTIVFIIAEKPKTPDFDLSVENSHLVSSLKVHVHVACLAHSKPMQELGKVAWSTRMNSFVIFIYNVQIERNLQ